MSAEYLAAAYDDEEEDEVETEDRAFDRKASKLPQAKKRLPREENEEDDADEEVEDEEDDDEDEVEEVSEIWGNNLLTSSFVSHLCIEFSL